MVSMPPDLPVLDAAVTPVLNEAGPALSPALASLCSRGAAFLGTRYAIMGGAMSWVSERNLVSAISNAGGFGVIACGSMPPDRLGGENQGTFSPAPQPLGVHPIT